jgi:D-aminopeptidase
MGHDAGMTRAADLGIRIGILPPGPTASIADVPGVGVGHATVWRDEPEPPEGRGIARTGVTVIDPGGSVFRDPIPAGGAVLNGAGECTGFLTMAEWGLTETPIFLTSTMQLGRVYDAACELLLAEEPEIGAGEVIIPVVAECDDSYLNETRVMQITPADVRSALRAARAASQPAAVRGTPPQAPDEGAVGAGTGMSCLGFKGGIGSSSRLTPSGHTVGVLVLTNFGSQDRLTIDGVPVGRLLPPASGQPPTTVAPEFGPPKPGPPKPGISEPGISEPGISERGIPEAGPLPPAGSCIVVVLTDGPLDSAACARLARRAGLGLARTGSTGHHGSGEIFLALATGLRAPRGQSPAGQPVSGSELDPFFAAVVEATEEAVLNSLFAAPTVTGRSGRIRRGLPVDQVRELLARGHSPEPR